MAVELADVRALKLELRRDLEAVERVERMILARLKGNGTQKPNGSTPTDTPAENVAMTPTDAVLRILLRAKKPLQTSEIVEQAMELYDFGSRTRAMGSITKVLFRQRNKNKVTRHDEGTYSAVK